MTDDATNTESAEVNGGSRSLERVVRRPASHARLTFYELMNSRRPWAHSKNVYDWMEELMDMAELAFTGRRRPTHEEYDEQTKTILKLTESLKEHPEWLDGACACEECRQDA